MDDLLFDRISVDVPDDYECAKAEECKHFFGMMQMDYAFLSKNNDGAFGVIRTASPLENDAVKSRIIEYQQYYSRMVPGFKMGEMRMNDQIGRNVAFVSYKSNAPTTDIFNMLAITTFEGKELVFLFACDLSVAFRYMYKFLRVLDSMSFAE